MQEGWHSFSNEQGLQAHGPCSCLPLSPLQGGEGRGQEEFLPVAPKLRSLLLTNLENVFPYRGSFSLLLLHIAQFEHIQLPPTSAVLHQKVSYHASASLQAQIVENIRRTLRADDQILADKQGTGVALLFPQVDQQGIACIAERVSRSINLLQAETVVPPLRYETEIVCGFASYPEPAPTLEELLHLTGQIQERIVFRPVVAPQAAQAYIRAGRTEDSAAGARSEGVDANHIPFLQIPSRLPARLKQLVPYSLAVTLRCAPVGRNHNQLTVAMANPMDAQALGRLREATGMTIFPVSCEVAALDTLLASDW